MSSGTSRGEGLDNDTEGLIALSFQNKLLKNIYDRVRDHLYGE